MSLNILLSLGAFFALFFEKTKSAKMSCNKSLLSLLKLSGHEYGEIVANNTVCGISSNDNCCSKIDEIKIVKAWNSYTSPKLKKFSNDMSEIYNQMTVIEPYLKMLNASNIDYHFDEIGWRRTNESQCFSGKFFLEASNYAMVKNHRNFTAMIAHRYSRILGRAIAGNSSGLITFSSARAMIRRTMNNSTRSVNNLINSFNSFAMRGWVREFTANLTKTFEGANQTEINFRSLVGNETKESFINRKMNLSTVINDTSIAFGVRFFVRSLQNRASNIHVHTLVQFINSTVRFALQNSWQITARHINVTAVVDEIIDEVFFDPVLKRYFAWFLVPTSRARFIRVFKYLENQILKIFSDTISRSAGLAEQPHFAVLKLFMSTMSDSTLNSVLENSYNRITGAIITHLGLANFTENVWQPNNTASQSMFYQRMVSQIYNASNHLEMSLDYFSSYIYSRNQEIVGFLQKLTNIVQSRNGNVFSVSMHNISQLSFLDAGNMFRDLNLRTARFAEFTGDNKRVCARVVRHRLVREAVFNEKKFEYCLKVTEDYNNRSAVEELGSLNQVHDQISKILELKKAYYCIACSSRNSKRISISSNTIRMSDRFCFAFVNTYRDFLDWRYLAFQKYQNVIYQYASCFERDANLTLTYPYEIEGGIIARNFTEWQDCRTMMSIQNISLCYSVCSQVKLTNYAEWIEGDLGVLTKLHVYVLTLLREYGIQYGKFNPKKGLNSTQTGPRILQEKERPIRYNLVPSKKISGRILQQSASDTTQANNTQNSSSSGNTSSSGNSSQPESPPKSAEFNAVTYDTSKLPKVFVKLLKDPLISLLYELLLTVDKTKSYTRKEHFNHDELTNGKVHYEVQKLFPDTRKMKTTISSSGCDPLKIMRKAKFGQEMLSGLTAIPASYRWEPLVKEVIRTSSSISKKDVHYFNADYLINNSGDFIEPEHETLKKKESNYRLFNRYKTPGKFEYWKKPSSEFIGSDEHKSSKILNNDHHRKLNQNKLEKDSSSGIGELIKKTLAGLLIRFNL